MSRALLQALAQLLCRDATTTDSVRDTTHEKDAIRQTPSALKSHDVDAASISSTLVDEDFVEIHYKPRNSIPSASGKEESNDVYVTPESFTKQDLEGAKTPSVRVGRVRFIAYDGVGSGYISRAPANSSETLFLTTQNVDEAMQARVCSETHKVELLNSNNGWETLGLMWYCGVPNFDDMGDRNATLTAMAGSGGSARRSCTYSGPCDGDVWDLADDDTLSTTWTDPTGGRHNLEACTYVARQGIVFIPDYQAFVNYGRSGYSPGVSGFAPQALNWY